MKKQAGILLPLVALAFGAPARGETLRVETHSQATQLSVHYGEQRIMVYAADPAKPKPYVKELSPLHGRNILRDAPFDHLHHHALMYGIRVNGLNFWEEQAGCGIQKGVTMPVATRLEGRNGSPAVRIEQTIYWVAPQDAFLPVTNTPALLFENRVLTLTVDEARKEVALIWDAQFEVGTKTNEVVLTGENYHGLGMRFQRTLDPLARHIAAGHVPDLSNNRQDVVASKWEAVVFDAPGSPATLVLAGHPANTRGDPTFFSMKTPFAYLAATQGLDREALIYKTGDKFRVSYLITVYAEPKSSHELEERYNRWVQHRE